MAFTICDPAYRDDAEWSTAHAYGIGGDLTGIGRCESRG